MNPHHERARGIYESPDEYLRRAISSLDYELLGLVSQLHSVEALLDFFCLYVHDYGTEYWSGILECIAEGSDELPALKFIARWNLPADWSEDVYNAVKLRKGANNGTPEKA